MTSAEAARNARADLLARIQRGETTATGALRLTDARTQFLSAAREGKALNKQGRRYKPRAIDDVEEALRVHVEPLLGSKRLTLIRRGDIQRIVDELSPRLPGSRVRSVVNAVRSLYRWAQDRDLATHDPAALVRLPAMNATRIERVASPAEFAQLLDALPLEMALPYALAGYGMGRRAQVIHLDWRDVDFELVALEWGTQLEGGNTKRPNAWFKLLSLLLVLLKRRFLESGRPTVGLLCPPLTAKGNTGLLNTGWLAKRAEQLSTTRGLQRITLQQARHSARTWLDAAGVSPKVAHC